MQPEDQVPNWARSEIAQELRSHSSRSRTGGQGCEERPFRPVICLAAEVRPRFIASIANHDATDDASRRGSERRKEAAPERAGTAAHLTARPSACPARHYLAGAAQRFARNDNRNGVKRHAYDQQGSTCITKILGSIIGDSACRPNGGVVRNTEIGRYPLLIPVVIDCARPGIRAEIKSQVSLAVQALEEQRGCAAGLRDLAPGAQLYTQAGLAGNRYPDDGRLT